ncbi:hypothetical protein Bxe_C1383 [Paraburkholderia xenovorans LB400]|uniref:Uncharacterized protein n=1 Tax=Paraburkholderia xenovorans (strain LB400) TaxID=266265 RepID=Q13FA8_PARXL|nr:hypothetical protein Bxe_C1383 [Paraburkholderia xenovorans LB400]
MLQTQSFKQSGLDHARLCIERAGAERLADDDACRARTIRLLQGRAIASATSCGFGACPLSKKAVNVCTILAGISLISPLVSVRASSRGNRALAKIVDLRCSISRISRRAGRSSAPHEPT